MSAFNKVIRTGEAANGVGGLVWKTNPLLKMRINWPIAPRARQVVSVIGRMALLAAALVGTRSTLKAQTDFDWTVEPVDWTPTPGMIGAHETKTLSVGYVGTPLPLGDVTIYLGNSGGSPGSPVLDIVGGTVTLTRGGVDHILNVSLTQFVYTFQPPYPSPITDVQDEDILTWQVKVKCGIPYNDEEDVNPVYSAKVMVNGVDESPVIAYSVYGPMIKFNDGGAGYGTVSGVGGSSITFDVTLNDVSAGLSIVPGDMLYLSWATQTGQSAERPRIIEAHYLGHSLPVTLDGVVKLNLIQLYDTDNDQIPDRSIYQDLDGTGQTDIIQLTLGTAALCNITNNITFDGNLYLGWKVMPDPASTPDPSVEFCDRDFSGLDVLVVAPDRDCSLSIPDTWKVREQLDPCYASSAGYFQVPYVFTNPPTSNEPLTIRRFELSRIRTSQYDGLLGWDQDDEGSMLVIDQAHPVLVDFMGATQDVVISTQEDTPQRKLGLHTNDTKLVLVFPDRSAAPVVAPGESVVIHVWMKVQNVFDAGELGCTTSERWGLNNYDAWLYYDWDCRMIEDLEASCFQNPNPNTTSYLDNVPNSQNMCVPPSGMELRIAAYRPNNYQYAVATPKSMLYVGSTHNVTSACFLGDDAFQVGGTVDCDLPEDFDPSSNPVPGWNIQFEFSSEPIRVFPRASSVAESGEVFALHIELDNYLYVNLEEVLLPEDQGGLPITITEADGTILYSTSPGPNQGLLELLGPQTMVNGVLRNGFCRTLDCPDLASSYQGWDGTMSLMLRIVNLGQPYLVTVGNSLSTQRELDLSGLRVKVPIRMHCPKDAGDTNCGCDAGPNPSAYVPGCTQSPDLAQIDAIAPPTPRTLKVALVHFPNAAPDTQYPTTECGDVCTMPKVNLACGTKQFLVRCPGCTRLGIHNDDYVLERWNYGATDGNGNRAEAMAFRQRDDLTSADAALRRDLAMTGDILWSELRTTIVSDVPQYGPYSGNDPIDLKYLYFKTEFKPGGIGVPPAQNTLAVKRPLGGTNTLVLNDDRAHLVHVGDVLEFSPASWAPPDGRRTITAIDPANSIATLSGTTNLIVDQWYHPSISTPLVTPLEVELEFRTPASPVGTVFTNKITVDLTKAPELFDPSDPNCMVHLDRSNKEVWMFDLSPEKLIQVEALGIQDLFSEVVPQPNPDPLFSYLQQGFDFMAPEFNKMKVRIRVKWQVSANIGAANRTVDVFPHAFLTAVPATGSGADLLDNFEEEPSWAPGAAPGSFNQPDFCDYLANNCEIPGSPNCDCNNYMYFCTKAGASFNLMGYELEILGATATIGLSPCEFGTGSRVRMRIGEVGYGDAFPNEFRNYFLMRSAKCDILAESTPSAPCPNYGNWDVATNEAWDPVGYILTQAYGAVATSTASPIGVEGVDMDHTYSSGTAVPHQLLVMPPTVDDGSAIVSLPSGVLALPDDGFLEFKVALRYAANANTASGRVPVVACVQGQAAPDPAYTVPFQMRFRMDPGGALPCPRNTIRAEVPGISPVTYECLMEEAPRIRYVQPQLRISSSEISSNSGQEVFGPLTVNLAADPNGDRGNTPLPHVWVNFCERLATEEGMPVSNVTIGSNTTGIVPYVNGNDRSYGLGNLQSSQNSFNINVEVQAPCDVPSQLTPPRFDVPPYSGQDNRAEILIMPNWTCASTPEPPVCPVSPESDWTAERPGSAWLQLDPQSRDLDLQSVTATQVGCAVEVTVEVRNPGSTYVPDARIGFVPPQGWAYVPQSATLRYGQSTPWTVSTGLSEMVEGTPTDLNCTTPSNDVVSLIDAWYWDLGGASLCPTCPQQGNGLFDPAEGIAPSTTVYFSFRVAPIDANECSVLAYGAVYVGDSRCDYTCKADQFPAILPGPTLTLDPVGPCDQGATLTVSVDAEQLALPQVVLVDIPEGLQVIDGPQDLCSGSTFTVLPNGDVEWTIATTAVPCSLQVQVGYVSCTDQAAYTITAGLVEGCCQAEVIFQGDVPPCQLSATTGASASTCGGPWQVLCGAFDPIGTKPFFIDGLPYVWENGGGSFIAYDQNVWTLTGTIGNTVDPNKRYWVQLYLDNPIDGTSWAGQVDPCNVCSNPDPTTWTYYGVSTVPTWESLLVGLGSNDGQIADLSAAPGFGFQFGEGASTYSDGLGSSMMFNAVLRDGSGTLSGKMAFFMNCDLTWLDFSPCSGKIEVTVSGGTGPYTVGLAGPNTASTIVTTTGYHMFDQLCNNVGLAPYVVTITDAQGCTTTLPDVFLDNGTLPLEADLVYDQVVCAGALGCAEVVSVTGGTPPYEVHWFWQGVQNGQEPVTAPNVQQCDLPVEQENWVVVNDANGCYITYKYFIQSGSGHLVFEVTGTDPECGLENGMVETEVAGGTGQLTYDWVPPVSTGPSATGLGSGTYSVTVTDEAGCTSTGSVVLTPDPTTVDVVFTQPSCHGGSDATATVQSIHGSPAILWSNGQTGITATGLGAGTYTVSLTYDDCMATGSVNITQPAPISVSIGYTDPTCAGGPCNGSATATITGAQGVVNHAWTNNGNGLGGSTSSVTGLCSGPVDVIVTDANGCSATASATIPALSCGPVINNCGNLNNLSRANGSVSVAPVPGALHYQFQFSTPCGYNRNIPTTAGSNVRPLNWSTQPLEDCQTYTVKARAFMDNPDPAPDNYGPWGPECTMTTNGCATPMRLKNAHIWPSNLTSLTGSVDVNKRNDAYRYQFEFWSVDANDAPVTVVKTVSPVAQGQTGYVYQSNKASVADAPQLSPCTKYKVRVRRSLDCGTNWENVWGPYALIKTSGTCPPGMIAQPGDGGGGAGATRMGLTLFPNPNDGAELNIVLTGIERSPAVVRIQMLDVLGRVIAWRELDVEGGILSTVLQLDPSLGEGLYHVRVMTGESVMTSSFVRER